ncbi:hypothetical protein LDENG_00099380 [Lucifuga dentata]|nr:hypothetical protein LDENG_00099380 [Lucifuga dentata]
MKSEAEKAMNQLKVCTLKRGDEETGSDSYTCAVCIESYKAGEVVTVLTCDHIFHKACIEPWLLERRTCPKRGISTASPPDVAVSQSRRDIIAMTTLPLRQT